MYIYIYSTFDMQQYMSISLHVVTPQHLNIQVHLWLCAREKCYLLNLVAELLRAPFAPVSVLASLPTP